MCVGGGGSGVRERDRVGEIEKGEGQTGQTESMVCTCVYPPGSVYLPSFPSSDS